MDEQHGIVAPVVADDEDGGIPCRDNREIAPADLGYFLPHANDALRPVQHRIQITPLLGDVDVFVAVRSLVDDWRRRLVTFGKAAFWLGRPLHWRARAIAFGQREV